MRSSLGTPAILLALLLVAPGCSSSGGGDDDDDGVDAAAAVIDANPTAPDAATADPPDANSGGGTAEFLGLPCTGTCPEGYECTVITGLGSTTEGFCTTACLGQDDTTTCSDGFPGPGTPGCILGPAGGAPEKCGITCTDSCPTGLGCFDTGQGVSLCAGDEGT